LTVGNRRRPLAAVQQRRARPPSVRTSC